MQCLTTAELGTDQLVGPLVAASLVMAVMVLLTWAVWRQAKYEKGAREAAHDSYWRGRRNTLEARVAERKWLIRKAWDCRAQHRNPMWECGQCLEQYIELRCEIATNKLWCNIHRGIFPEVNVSHRNPTMWTRRKQ